RAARRHGPAPGGAPAVTHTTRRGQPAPAAHLAAKDEKKKSGFFAKLGKFLIVVVILIILFFVLLIVGIVYAAKRIFGRRK
ncbi:hypothetical protein ACFV84_13680, partial [Kitasatospora sp. NPDC059811]